MSPALTGRIAFTRYLSEQEAEIWVVEGRGRARLLIGDRCWNDEPAWSPDGRRIAFVSDRSQQGMNIWVLDLVSRELQQLTFLDHRDASPAWDPAGERLVFVSNRAGHYNLWFVTLDRSSLEPLTIGKAHDYAPAWSPDGATIAFSSTRSGQDEIWILDVSTHHVHRLTDGPGRKVGPAWSPNGQWLAYIRIHADERRDVWLISRTGRISRRLLSDLNYVQRVVWSPDGRSLLVSLVDKTGRSQFRLVDTRTGSQTPLQLRFRHRRPLFSPRCLISKPLPPVRFGNPAWFGG